MKTGVKLKVVKNMGQLDTGETVMALYIRTTEPEEIECMARGDIWLARKQEKRGRPRKEKR
jgi:hypothetical protein